MEHQIASDVKSLSWIVSDRIKEYIVHNNLKPGGRLPTERKLSEALAVSRPVVREALGQLETLGLIDKHQGRGLFVKEQNMSRLFQEMMLISSSDKEKLRQLLEFRSILEQAALARIINHVAPEKLLLLLVIIEEAEAASSDKQFSQLDREFHRQLIQLTDNPYLLQLTTVIDNYFALIEQSIARNEITLLNRKQTNEQHRQLLAFIREGDKSQALDLIEKHLLSHYSQR